MKRLLTVLMAAIMVIGLCACGQKSETAPEGPSWQEQYDLGIRYLSEGKYEEAILAFTAAIEIDPKRADAYLSLADAYLQSGDAERANAVLQDALDRVEDADAIEAMLAKLLSNRPVLEGYPKTERQELAEGGYVLTEYNQYGDCIAQTYYQSENQPMYHLEWTYDASGNLVSKYEKSYEEDDALLESYTEYDEQRRPVSVQEIWIDSVNSYVYDYSGADVRVSMAFDSDQWGLVEDEFSYTMSADAHHMTVAGTGYSAEGIDVHHLMEFDEWEGILRDIELEN